MGLTYFKRFRMEIDLRGRDFSRPRLQRQFYFVPWDAARLEAHAETKYNSFRAEIDSNVFPCLGEYAGCLRLMEEIATKPGFLPEATWLVACNSVESDFDKADDDFGKAGDDFDGRIELDKFENLAVADARLVGAADSYGADKRRGDSCRNVANAGGVPSRQGALGVLERTATCSATKYCGTVQGVYDRSGMGAIQNLGVLPEYRGLGLGTALMHQALAGFQKAGLKRAFLEVTAQNSGAVRLYKQLGFSRSRTVYKVSEVAYA